MIDNISMFTGDRGSIHQALAKPVSKYRHVEPEYWLNKLNKRRKLAKIARKSRKRNLK